MSRSRPPTDAEVAALGRTAAYLDRAASEVGTRLLGRNGLDGDAALLASLRESLLQSAGLCADLLDLAARRGGEGMATRERPATPDGHRPVPVITDDQIAAAMERAVELAKHAARDPNRVQPVPLGAGEAMRRTAHWREHRWSAGDWCLLGWVWEEGHAPGWAVWWDPASDRVWLKAEGR